MAAIDPSASIEAEAGAIPRATLKIIREPIRGPEDEDSEEDDDDEEYMRALLAESDSEDDDEAGPSDKKAKKEAALKELMASIGQGEDESDEDMEDAPKSKKGKKAIKGEESEEDSEEESDDEDEEDMEVEEFVICTLDPSKNFQQPLDIVIGEDERVFFKVDGTHDVYLTGNYLIPDDNGRNTHHEVYDSEDDEDDEDDEDYDLSPDEDELDDEEESDELDTLENPRITELEDEVPALVSKKGKNKRAAEEPAESLDEIMEKSGEKLSKKQQKKLKTNEAKAAAAPEPKESAKDAKAVKFAKNLEMGPTGSDAPKAPEKKKETLGPRLVDGIKIDDKKIGTGPGATKGDRLSMRYIGKLEDGKVFDSNKSGKPFTFTLGIKEVITGWDTGILGMKVGGERRLTIPAKAAYGSQKLPGIPANSTLIFDIKLLDIKHKGKKN